MGEARITFDFRRGTIVVEGPTDDLTKLFEAARTAAPALKQIHIVTATGAPAPTHSPSAEPIEGVAPAPQARAPSMRDFAQLFAIENVSVRIAALAYYSAEYGRKPFFSAREMSSWFEQCGFKKPAQMAVALSDARRKYDYVKSRGRDQWTLTPRGRERLLELLTNHSAS